MIMVRADTGIESISDLPGAYYCRPSETSTVGWRIPRMMMLAEGLDPDLDLVVMDAGGYPAMFEAIINGDCDAGGAWVDARDDFAADFPNIHDQIAVIAESPPIPYDVFAVNPGIAAEAADALTEALLALDDDPDRWAAIVETWYWGDELVNLTDDAFYPLFDLWSVSGLSFYEFLD
jgi:phosphonate transport system substrate-binding protein